MDLSILFLGVTMTVLLLIGAGVGTAMVLLERPGAQPASATAMGGAAANGRLRVRRARSGADGRRKA
jgi:hypothetical protein